jgi:CIC family chloride channel protein
MVYFWAKEAKGHGVPEVMDAIARKAGVVRPRVVLVKALASVVTIGTGGSVGWEGPIIQIGAGVGSTTGQLLRVARRHMRVLVACGAAAGIAATFKAPMAGVLFALEVFIGDLAVVTFAPVVVAAVAGAAVSVAHLGPEPVFDLAGLDFKLNSVLEIPSYAVLGLLCAAGAVFFTRLIYLFEDSIDAVKLPGLVKPALGGLAVGAIAIGWPEVLGVGYNTIEQAYTGEFALKALAALFFLKAAATCFTLGSGGSGGIFAPSLVLGAVGGAAFGGAVHRILPDMTATAGVYSVVGMAAFVAGTTHAPISALLILFEMTQDYAIILPLMIACIVSTTAARGMLRESIYTLKLARRGIHLRGGRDEAILRSITVQEVMRRDPVVFPEGLSFTEVRARMLSSNHHVYPVIDGSGALKGVVSLDPLRPFLVEEGLSEVAVAADLAEECIFVLHPDDDLQDARELFARGGMDEVPVIERSGRRVVGVLREPALRTMETLARIALSLWIGAVAAVGFLVAPVVFSTLDDNALAGEVMAPIFRGVDAFGIVATLLVLVVARGLRAWLAGIAGLAAAANVLLISPRIGGRDLYHHISTGLWIAILLLGVILLALGPRPRE